MALQDSLHGLCPTGEEKGTWSCSTYLHLCKYPSLGDEKTLLRLEAPLLARYIVSSYLP